MNEQSKCYICGSDLISDNISDEHIIINAAGGRLKSKNLICHKCNISFGDKIDSKLSYQLNNISNMLMINRHRGEPQPINAEMPSTGDKYKIDVGGKPRLSRPIITKYEHENQTRLSIYATTERELREVLKGLARNSPNFDVVEAMKTAKWNKEYLKEALQVGVEIGGAEVFRAVCKCAMNYFVYTKGDPKYIKDLIPYIRGTEDKELVWMHYQDDLYDLKPDECSHIIHLVGNKKEKVLYCYVDYFNTFKYLILLNSNYEGSDLTSTYFYDLINAKLIQRKVKIDYKRDELIGFIRNRDHNHIEKIQKSFQHSLNLAFKRQHIYQTDLLLEKAIKNSLGKYKEGTIITEDIIEEVVSNIVNELIPYLVHNMKR